MTFIDILDGGPAPKRGDLVQSNVGKKKERTWFILRVRSSRIASRYNVWMVRWWELSPRFRSLLFESAERNGGQRVIFFKRYPARKRKRTFEQYMEFRCRMLNSKTG